MNDFSEGRFIDQAIQNLIFFKFCIIIYFYFYLFIHEKHTERGRDIGREGSRLRAGSPMWDSVPGLQDDVLSQRQMLNH